MSIKLDILYTLVQYYKNDLKHIPVSILYNTVKLVVNNKDEVLGDAIKNLLDGILKYKLSKRYVPKKLEPAPIQIAIDFPD